MSSSNLRSIALRATAPVATFISVLALAGSLVLPMMAFAATTETEFTSGSSVTVGTPVTFTASSNDLVSPITFSVADSAAPAGQLSLRQTLVRAQEHFHGLLQLLILETIL